MLKLLIVDDEEIICTTIAQIIDWEQMGIQVIGTCLNGVDAYHTILDESPDIVMTDIRMPGLSGLELIERISRTNLNTQFIILSGYGEFDYAKQAMQAGVRHYLLKPCDKQQIIDCIQKVIQDCSQIRYQKELEQKTGLFNKLHTTLIHNMISAGIAAESLNPSFFDAYERFVDFTDSPYQLCCLYYLEMQCLEQCLNAIDAHMSHNAPQLSVYRVYAANTLLLFFPDYTTNYRGLDYFMGTLSFQGQQVSPEYKRSSYNNLRDILCYVIPRLKRYDVIYFADGSHLIPNYNYDHITSQVSELCQQLTNPSEEIRAKTFQDIADILHSISNKNFLLQIATQLLVALSTQISSNEIVDISDFLSDVATEDSLSSMQTMVLDKCKKLLCLTDTQQDYSLFVTEILNYLETHISDSNLTLKWIAENYLYMNVKYVSRCFARETGQKFSAYLTELRIEKAKEILLSKNSEKIQNVAELVGCGNNPYYFSRLFKKCTGMTPSAYIKQNSQ